jgi:hypothetical protein
VFSHAQRLVSLMVDINRFSVSVTCNAAGITFQCQCKYGEVCPECFLLLLQLAYPVGVAGHNLVTTDMFLISAHENYIYWCEMWTSWGPGY